MGKQKKEFYKVVLKHREFNGALQYVLLKNQIKIPPNWYKAKELEEPDALSIQAMYEKFQISYCIN